MQGSKRNILKYEEIDECRDALLNGEEMNVTVAEFAKDPLIREFGEKFYKEITDKYAVKN